jgi:hypothetical protein
MWHRINEVRDDKSFIEAKRVSSPIKLFRTVSKIKWVENGDMKLSIETGLRNRFVCSKKHWWT